MKLAFKINWILVTLLSIATGIFKVMQQEADIALFAAIGMGAVATTALGAIQVVGGILMIPAKTRGAGAWVMVPTYILASVAVFANQMWAFGAVSLLFIGMAYLVTRMESPS